MPSWKPSAYSSERSAVSTTSRKRAKNWASLMFWSASGLSLYLQKTSIQWPLQLQCQVPSNLTERDQPQVMGTAAFRGYRVLPGSRVGYIMKGLAVTNAGCLVAGLQTALEKDSRSQQEPTQHT